MTAGPQMTAGFQFLWRKRLVRSLLAAFAVTGLGTLVIWGFLEGRGEVKREAERERPVKEPLRISMKNGVTVITLDNHTQQNSGIETTSLMAAPYQEQVRAYATVLDAARLTDLTNNYANAQAQLQTAQAKLAASKAAFERAQKLYKSNAAVSLAVVQAAEATFLADQAALASAESQVRALAATAYQEWGPVLGKSLVDRSPSIVRLIERQAFLLQVTLPPGISLLKAPETGAVQTAPNTRAEIRFVSPATRTDPKIQGVSYFYVTPAESEVLPGMNILAFLPSGKEVDGVTVPASAIVWWQDRAWVYRRLDPERFTRADIATDLPLTGGGYVVGSLPKPVEIVTRGAQLLLSEEFRAQIQVGEDKK
jgi:hypothetical protein